MFGISDRDRLRAPCKRRLTAAVRSAPCISAAEVEGGIGNEGGCGYRHEVDGEAKQPLIEDAFWRNAHNRGGPQPSREYRQLNSRRHADQVASSRVVSICQACGDANDGRDRETR